MLTAEFQDILPRLTLEKKANRGKIAKNWLSLRQFVAMATVIYSYEKEILGVLVIFTVNARNLKLKLKQIVQF